MQESPFLLRPSPQDMQSPMGLKAAKGWFYFAKALQIIIPSPMYSTSDFSYPSPPFFFLPLGYELINHTYRSRSQRAQ